MLARTVKKERVIGRTAVVGPIETTDNVTEVYVAGYTEGDLGASYQGSGDAFLRRLYSADGGTVWTK